MLRDSHCRVTRIDATTFLLVLTPPNPRPSAPKPSPAALAPSPLPPIEVIVTANRRPQSLGETPAAASLVPAGVLLDSDATLSAIAGRVPGLTVTNLGAGRDKILLRGISDGVFTGRTQSTVGLYLDDTPITYNAPDPDLLLVDMARVEVLRGPQGALYGEGSISGVVRLVTNKPAFDKAAAMIEASLAVTAGGAPSSRTAAMVNIPLAGGRVAIRGVAYDDQAGGYIDDLGIDRRNTNSAHRYGGRLALRARLGTNWQGGFAYATQEINVKNSQYAQGGRGAYTRRLAIREPHDNDFSHMALNLEGPLAGATFKATVNHLHHHLRTRYDASALATATGVTRNLVYDEDQTVELETEDVSLASRPDQAWRWLAGLFGSQGSETFRPGLTFFSGGAPFYREDRHDQINTLAGFGEVAVDLTPQLTVTAGLRMTSVDHTTDSQSVTAPATGPQAVAYRLRDHHVSHQVVVRYRPDPRLMLYAQSAEGYRDAGFNTTQLAQASLPPRYSGDELNSYETGARLDLADHRLRLSTAVFHVLWRDIQSDQLQSSGLPVTVNIGDGVNNGFEIEGDWQALDDVTLHGAALLNEPQLTRPNPLYATAEDSGLPFIARSAYSLSADWRKTAGNLQMTANATLTAHGVSHLNFGVLQNLEMGGYTQLDLAASATTGRVRYGLRLDNATGVRANSFAYGNPFSITTMAQATPLRPPTLWLSVRFVE